MDMDWIVNENMAAFREGHICGRAAAEAILTGVAMSEVDTIKQYQKAKQAICTALEQWPKERDIIGKMMDKIIADEGDHTASAQKAAMACSGNKEPKAKEYDEAVKEIDRQTD